MPGQDCRLQDDLKNVLRSKINFISLRKSTKHLVVPTC